MMLCQAEEWHIIKSCLHYIVWHISKTFLDDSSPQTQMVKALVATDWPQCNNQLGHRFSSWSDAVFKVVVIHMHNLHLFHLSLFECRVWHKTAINLHAMGTIKFVWHMPAVVVTMIPCTEAWPVMTQYRSWVCGIHTTYLITSTYTNCILNMLHFISPLPPW
jgi:hypothetical protein